MVNINDKNWDKLRISDIEKLLENDDDETFFFEYKNDDVTPKKIVEEISAFANTYGGYILLGVDDDKNISGCKKWNEQRIHNTIHNCITPIPSFDIKKFRTRKKENIYVIKIDEGILPPYITNNGKIYERVSSGSFPINDSIKLTQLYYKREDQFKKIENKIKIEELRNDFKLPGNICGYLDLGFSITTNDLLKFQRDFFNINVEEISDIIKKDNPYYSISRVGYSLVISIGKVECNQNGNTILPDAGISNFIEIMCDGSIRCRVVLYSDQDNNLANISQFFCIPGVFTDIYKCIVGGEFYKKFINAYKYEKLTVLKQCIPYIRVEESDEYKSILDKYLKQHIEKYGNNLIITGNRIPKNGFVCIDKKYFSDFKIKFDNKNLINELFRTEHIPLGYIDNIEK